MSSYFAEAAATLKPEDYELAKKYLFKREAHDIIEMLGL